MSRRKETKRVVSLIEKTKKGGGGIIIIETQRLLDLDIEVRKALGLPF